MQTTTTTAAAPVAVVVLDDGQTWATAATAALITADAFAFLEAGGRFQDLDPVAIVAEAPVRPPPAPAATDTTTDTTDTTTNTDTEDIDLLRLAALARHLDLDDEEAADLEADDRDPARIEYGRREYLVLTDEEADEHAREYLTESLWAFRAGFLASYCSLPASTIETMQAKLCEGFQEAALKLVGDRLDELLNDAISSDGRGPALAHYDHNEEEATVNGVTFYIYRTN